MPQDDENDELVGMTVQVPPYIRYAFRDLAENTPEGATKLMTEFVENKLREQCGKYGIPMAKRDYAHSQGLEFDFSDWPEYKSNEPDMS